MFYRIVLTTVESTTVEATCKEEAEEIARRFEGECNSQHHHREKTHAELRTVPVMASCQRLTLTGVDDPEGRIVDAE